MALKIEQPRTMDVLIMEAVLAMIVDEIAELKKDDPTKLALVEFRPRSEDFADRLLSCTIAPNDPDSPGSWEDTEISKWPPKQDPFSQDYGKNFGEMGGGQGFSLRFALDFRLFYNELGLVREDAIIAAKVILARIHTAILRDNVVFRSLKDDFGVTMVSWNKAVKTKETLPAGSADETFVNARMKLQFEVYHE